jgi:hypothetical protein
MLLVLVLHWNFGGTWGRDIGKDLFSILKRTKPQHALVKQSRSIGHFTSKRRPIDLTPEQSASVNSHPLLRRLTYSFGHCAKDPENTEQPSIRGGKKSSDYGELKQQIRDN